MINEKFDLSALHVAAGQGDVELAQYLLENGANLDARTGQGVTPLMCAAAGGHRELVDLLLSMGADAAKIDCRGGTDGDAFGRVHGLCPDRTECGLDKL